MKLPNGGRAHLGTKLEEYSLNPIHLEGRHKAHVFSSVLGITLDEIETLRAAVLAAGRISENAMARGHNSFGDVYVLRFPITTTRGTATVLTAWIIRDGEDFPRLTTCYII